jgi:ankyrin repeat protein
MNDKQHILNIALDDAINRAELEEVKGIVEMGANIEARDPLGKTPLMNAAWVAATEIVEFLIKQGADTNALDNDGRSVLELIKEIGHNEYGHNDVIVLLKKYLK